MATKGSTKELSQRHESFVAQKYCGKVSRSSGAAEHDAGDVKTELLMIECKMTGHPGKEPKSLPTFIRQLEKVTLEAWEHDYSPMLALRYYAPGSPLASHDGWVDVAVRPLSDDREREWAYERWAIGE